MNTVPLIVDLDGTVLASDVLWESFARLLFRKPWAVFSVLFALCTGGRAGMKRSLAGHVSLAPELLPYRHEVVSFVRESRDAGRLTILATASDERIAVPIASYLGCFDEVLASDGRVNLKGSEKAEQLVARFGEHGFDYLGDSRADRAVWRRARTALVVGASSERPSGVQVIGSERTFAVRLGSFVRALRPHQWMKNLLLFLPLLMAHRVTDGASLAGAAVAFVVFSLVASSVYLLNDLGDLDSDRQHRTKHRRPFAAGALSLSTGLFGTLALLVTGVALALLFLPPLFLVVLGSYVLGTVVYSFGLKRILVLDIVVLALLYVTRIIAGGAAAEVVVSPWLLAFALFFFLSLAAVKRYSELLAVLEKGRAIGRGYDIRDREQIGQLGSAAGYLSVVILALYINSDAVKAIYSQPPVLWAICPILLYWIGRVWVLAGRGVVDEDPILFALRDRVSYVVGALITGIVMGAL